MKKTIMTLEEFKDVRNHDFFRLAAITPRVHLGNPQKNVRSHLEQLEEVYSRGAMYALCPELSLTGYSMKDAFLDETLLEAAQDGLWQLSQRTKQMRMIITVGLPLLVGQSVYNCAATIFRGRVLSILPKSYLPNYREFEEERWFAQARHLKMKEVRLKKQFRFWGESVPIGTDIMIQSEEIPELLLAGDICEDLWTVVAPSSIAALNQATVLFNGSGSNVTMGKNEYRRRLMYKSGDENSIRLYASSGFGEAVSDVAWDFHAMIADRGTIIAESERFNIHPQNIMADVCLKAVIFDRMRQGSFRDNAMDYRKEYRRVMVEGKLGCNNRSVYRSFITDIDPYPFVPLNPETRDARCWDVLNSQITSLASKFHEISGGNLKKAWAVVAVSGGQDSTQALLATAKAMDELGLPRTNIIGITMPGFGTTSRTKNVALNLMRHLGVTEVTIDIRPLARQLFKAIGHDPKNENLTFENAQARLRKLIELMIGGQIGAIDINTSDLSEAMVGWCTKGGDHAGDFGVNSGIPKTLITSLLLWEAEKVFIDEPEVQQDISDCVGLPISPELRRHRKNVITQKSESEIGPNALRDFYSYYFWRFGFKPTRLARMCYHAFDGEYQIGTIKKWLGDFLRRFFLNQHKRLSAPEGIKMGSVCTSQRGDMRLPSGIDPTIWLNDVARIPNKI